MPQAKAATDLTRRQILKLGATLTLSCLSLPAFAHSDPSAERRLLFYNLHTGEKLDRVYWAEGRYLSESLAEIDGLMRDFRTGEVKPIDRKLLDLLYLVRRTLGSDEAFGVVSAYRSPATNAKLLAQGRGVRKNSLHMRGMAIDIRLPGRDTGALWHAAISARRGGTGFYPKYDFVHLDVGPHWHWCKPSRCNGGAPRPG
jgi:uncharacterized protein YcbK (DUF882 family)